MSAIHNSVRSIFLSAAHIKDKRVQSEVIALATKIHELSFSMSYNYEAIRDNIRGLLDVAELIDNAEVQREICFKLGKLAGVVMEQQLPNLVVQKG